MYLDHGACRLLCTLLFTTVFVESFINHIEGLWLHPLPHDVCHDERGRRYYLDTDSVDDYVYERLFIDGELLNLVSPIATRLANLCS